MRYDDEKYLKAWKERGVYPVIHDSIFDVCANYAMGSRFCDLGSCTGLLTNRLNRYVGRCIGVEANGELIELGSSYGTYGKVYCIKMTRETLPWLMEKMRAHNVNTVVARRIMPEAFGEDLQTGHEFARLCYQDHIRKVILQGRITGKRSVNALKNITDEVQLFEPFFLPVYLRGDIAVLHRANPINSHPTNQ